MTKRVVKGCLGPGYTAPLIRGALYGPKQSKIRYQRIFGFNASGRI
jgi:hypothetical protein